MIVLLVNFLAFAQEQPKEEEQAFARQLYQSQANNDEKAFYEATYKFMYYLERQQNWEKYYNVWMNMVIFQVNNKQYHRAFSEIHRLTDDINENDREELLYIPNQALGFYYNSRNQPEMGERYFLRALQSIDTVANPLATFNTYLSLAQSLSFKKPAGAMRYLDCLPQSMLNNPMTQSGVLGYRCIIAYKQDNMEAFDRYYAQYDSIRRNQPDQFNAANLPQVMVSHDLMHKNYDRALTWCDSIDVPAVASELRMQVYEQMGLWKQAYRQAELKDSLAQIEDNEVMQEDLEALTHDIDMLQAEHAKAVERRNQLIIISVMGLVIIGLLVGILIYRYVKNRRLRHQFEQLQEARRHASELRAIRRAIVNSMYEQLMPHVNILDGYARVVNDPKFNTPPHKRKKMFSDIMGAVQGIKSLINPVLDSITQGSIGIDKEQRAICHDALRSPLQALTSMAEMLADDKNQLISDADYRQMCLEISKESDLVATSIRELLMLSLIDEDLQTTKNDEVNLNDIALSTLNSYDLSNRKLGTQFNTDVPDSLKITTNQDNLRELLNCLLANADRFATGGNITMECLTQSDGTYSIAVINEGPAIPAKEVEHIFMPFVRLSAEAHTLGIGLTLARQLASSLGYTVSLDTSYRQGVRFVISGIS